MSHDAQIDFFRRTKEKYFNFFVNSNILEIGSLNINGSIRPLFENCNYLGIDVGPGLDVDVVYEGQKYPGPDNYYDTVVSTECFEHNPFWLETFLNMWRMTKPNGLIIFTCATIGRSEHGTIRTDNYSNPLGISHGWDYYKNLSALDFETPLNMKYFFKTHEFEQHDDFLGDLYFSGIKRRLYE